MIFFTIAGIAGLIFLLAAFALLEAGVISDGTIYLVLNAAGSLALIIYALGTSAYIFILLNGVWFIVAAVKIIILSGQKRNGRWQKASRTR